MDVAALAPVTPPSEAETAMHGSAGASSAALTAVAGGVPPRRAGLGPTIAQLFGQAVTRPAELDITYAVSPDHEIVIVFSDPTTGKEVATFPPHLFAQLAEFLDHQQGAAVDLDA